MLISNEPAFDSEELLSRARRGDPEAFCLLATSHEERLFRQALALCHNASTAEDLAAETIIEAWKSLSRFDGKCRFSTWLYGILLHRFQKLLRRSGSRPIPMSSLSMPEARGGQKLLEDAPDAQPAPSERLSAEEASHHLRQAIATLPAGHQQVVLMRFYEDAPLPEIATALELPLGTVKSRLHHALEKLRHNRDLLNFLQAKGDT